MEGITQFRLDNQGTPKTKEVTLRAYIVEVKHSGMPGAFFGIHYFPEGTERGRKLSDTLDDITIEKTVVEPW